LRTFEATKQIYSKVHNTAKLYDDKILFKDINKLKFKCSVEIMQCFEAYILTILSDFFNVYVLSLISPDVVKIYINIYIIICSLLGLSFPCFEISQLIKSYIGGFLCH